MVAVKFVTVRLLIVLAISVTVPEKSAARADCHFVMLPVFPLNVNGVLFVPVHTVAPPPMLPPTLAGFTVTTPLALLADVHAPLVTTAR